jgi:hypothetical protein
MGVGNGEGAKTLNTQQHLSISGSALIEKKDLHHPNNHATNFKH